MAEQNIVKFAESVECETYEEVEQALEILIEKSARAIEKHRGLPAAQMVCQRVYANLINNPQR
jgi:hypothetical protein